VDTVPQESSSDEDNRIRETLVIDHSHEVDDVVKVIGREVTNTVDATDQESVDTAEEATIVVDTRVIVINSDNSDNKVLV
jgi:hypothetical protein